jgi:ATP-binding cassette subfamily B (MDR/TAP) protein 1
MAGDLQTPSLVSHDELDIRKENLDYDLTEEEQQTLASQLSVPPIKASYWMLFRYATKVDILIIIISAVFAIGAGVVLPLMTVSSWEKLWMNEILTQWQVIFGSLASKFQSFFGNSPDVASFRHEISHLSLDFVYLGIASFCALYIATVGFIYTGDHITQKLREQYLSSILSQNIAFFDKLGAGEITTRITGDMSTIQDGISQKVGLTLTGVSTFCAALVVGFVKNWKLTLILTSVIVSMVVAMSGFARLMIRFNKKSQEFSGTGATIAEEVFSSIRNATALGTQERLAKEYDRYLLKAERWAFKMKCVTGVMLGTLMSIIFFDYGLSFWEGSRLLVSGELSLGQIITILLAVMMGAVSLGQVAPHAQAFAVATAAAGPIFSVIDRPSSEDNTKRKELYQVRGDIQFKGIKHVYPSRPEVVVMHDVNLVIPAGKVTALVGASGSGKSTIVGLVERFHTPIRGQVLLDGHDLQTLDLRWLRRQMALVSQEPVLFGTTIYANIAHGLIGSKFSQAGEVEKRDLVINAAKMANAHAFITALPEGYDTNVGERGFLL